MRFDDADHDLGSLLQLLLGGLQHRIGLSDARRHPEENFQLAAGSRGFVALHPRENLIGIRPVHLAHTSGILRHLTVLKQ